jgi:glutamate-1-semialdehyde 2,1-aminomutase
VYQAGTLSGNPLATAAGLAALDLCDHDAYRFLRGQAACLAAGLQGALDAAGIPAVVSTAGPLIGLHLGTEAPHDYASARTTDEAGYARLFHAMLRRGVAMAPGAYEVMFPGLAHDDAAMDRIVEVAGAAAVEAAADAAPGSAPTGSADA